MPKLLRSKTPLEQNTQTTENTMCNLGSVATETQDLEIVASALAAE